jgi:hypothetical protein
MEFLLLIHSEEAGWGRMSAAEQGAAMAAYQAYTEALAAAGALRMGQRLQPAATATRVSAGGAVVLDGPYAETKEQLGGFYLIDVADRAAALDWARRCPGAAHGTVELRPLWS